MNTMLPDCLSAFVQSVNGNAGLATLLKGWEPLLVIEATDSGQQFHYQVRNCRIRDASEGGADGSDPVLLRSDSDTLAKVFSGVLNPARAYLEGSLEVFGSDRDQIKLDAISLVLWGM